MGTTSASAATKFVVTSPTTKAALPGKVTVSAKLNAKRSARIVSAKFYVNGKRITTDNHYPFKVKRGVKFDTRNLSTAKPTVRLSVVFKIRKSNGKLKKRTLKRNVRIQFFLIPNPSVGAKATEVPQVPQCAPTATPELTKFGYPLAFSDEFDCAPLNTAKWNTQRFDSRNLYQGETGPFPRPFHGLEGAAYATANSTVSNGALNLTLSDTTAPGQLNNPDVPVQTRSTGMVNTKNKFAFKYGYVETRAWVSDCVGCWPTFWTMPENDDWPPEIDIFEFINPIGAQARYPHSIVHWAPDGPAGDSQPPNEYFKSEPDDPPQEWFVTHPAGKTVDYMGAGEWHTYGMLWTSTSVKFYVDGVLGSEVVGATKLPQQAMYLIYQMAIGNSSFGVPPAGSALTVDYVRVFSSNT